MRNSGGCHGYSGGFHLLSLVICWQDLLMLFHFFLAGTHTIAIIKQNEEHDAWKAYLANVIDDVNSFARDGCIGVDGQEVKLAIYLGGDFEVNRVILSIPRIFSRGCFNCCWRV